MKEIKTVLEEFLETFPTIKGATIESLNYPISESVGVHIDEIKNYKDVIISSVDEGFQPQFSFLMLERGSVVVFFLDIHSFVCVYMDDMMPNKELTLRMYNQFKDEFIMALQFAINPSLR